MNIIFETERLSFRTFTSADAPLILELNLDPEVTKFTHDRIQSLSKATEVLEKIILPQYLLYGHGRWAVHLRSTNEPALPAGRFIGWCGLKYRAEKSETDLGFRFKKNAWGKGFATEAAMATIKYGFEKLKLRRIVGWAEHDNIASWKVLEKSGMIYIGEDEVDEHPVKVYEILNPFVSL